jgi:hypothetical protein
MTDKLSDRGAERSAGRDYRCPVRFSVRDIAGRALCEKSIELGLRQAQELLYIVSHIFS